MYVYTYMYLRNIDLYPVYIYLCIKIRHRFYHYSPSFIPLPLADGHASAEGFDVLLWMVEV